jgi:hypothetical protein
MAPGVQVSGPAIVESSFTTVVLNPGAIAERAPSGSLVIVPDGGEHAGVTPLAGAAATKEES